jgi:hypothetical protein
MLQFGHDKNFIGNGYRSLILSDYAKEYPFLKLITQVWKIQYMNLFMEHIDYRATPDNEAFMRKYSALHHLSINIGQHLNIGLFENVIYDRHEDVEREGFDIQYLNPLIFYRAVEHGLNSTDNVVLGMDWKWNFLGRFSFYRQFVVDEFRKQDFFKQSSSWVNKWGYQLGLKYINVAGISHLDLQLELNQLRPYIYQHFTTSQNWIQFNQSLAHPLGANFREGIAIIRYQPLNRLFINFLFSASLQGKDSMNGIFNYGNDVTRDYENIPNKENVQLFQGTSSNIKSLDLTLSYMLFHNLFVDMRFYYRTASGNHYPQAIENLIIGGGLRLNTSLERWE